MVLSNSEKLFHNLERHTHAVWLQKSPLDALAKLVEFVQVEIHWMAFLCPKARGQWMFFVILIRQKVVLHLYRF